MNVEQLIEVLSKLPKDYIVTDEEGKQITEVTINYPREYIKIY